jgi:hypothetical protein
MTRRLIGTGLLGAACCLWAAVPLHGTGQILLLVVGLLCAVGDMMRLAGVGIVLDTSDYLAGRLTRLWLWLYGIIRQLPWAEGAALAALGLEALHPSRAWHTGLLGVALLCYVLATHLTESRASLRVLRVQVPVLGAGLGLLVLCAGAAALPATAIGAASGLLRVLAAVAAVAVAALVLPVS